MALSSDKLSNLGKPLLQLKLGTTIGDGADREHLVEMDLDELNLLLKRLRDAQAVRFALYIDLSEALIISTIVAVAGGSDEIIFL